MSNIQQALFVQSKLGQLTIADCKVPEPGPDQLLVRIEAVALNPIDWKARKFGLYLNDSQYPAVLGSDVAGVVVEVGDGVSNRAVGDRVVFPASWLSGHGAFQQYTLADALLTAKLPSQISFEEASTLPVAIAAAVIGLYLPEPFGAGFIAPFDPSARGKETGTPIVIFGGATSVGQYVIQFARLSGFSPIITTASLKHKEYLESLGATDILDRNLSSDKLSAKISKIAKDPIQIIYDAVSSPDTQNMGYHLLAEGGKLVVLLEPTITRETGKNVIRVMGIFTLHFSRELGVQLYSAMTNLLAEGLIKPNRLDILPGGLSGIADGLERLELNRVSGVKLIIRPQETPTN
ncbi:hypothetical protein H0H92_013166 [Tricholoma furcatifolium]|nr:hypothetical protein H0H92_013166 [Tricholoma furcatifolium]